MGGRPLLRSRPGSSCDEEIGERLELGCDLPHHHRLCCLQLRGRMLEILPLRLQLRDLPRGGDEEGGGKGSGRGGKRKEGGRRQHRAKLRERAARLEIKSLSDGTPWRRLNSARATCIVTSHRSHHSNAECDTADWVNRTSYKRCIHFHAAKRYPTVLMGSGRDLFQIELHQAEVQSRHAVSPWRRDGGGRGGRRRVEESRDGKGSWGRRRVANPGGGAQAAAQPRCSSPCGGGLNGLQGLLL